MKSILTTILILIILSGCGSYFETTPAHLDEQNIVDYIWVEPIPSQLAYYYGNPNDTYELSSPKLWGDYLILYGVDFYADKAKYFKINKEDVNMVEEWDSFVRPSVNIFITFQANSIIKDDFLIFTYSRGPITIIDLHSMTTLYQSNFGLASREITLLDNKVIFKQIVDNKLQYGSLNLENFRTEKIYSTSHNNSQIFESKVIPEFSINQDHELEVITIEKTNDTTYYVQRINTNSQDTIWRTLCDQKEINNGPYHILSDSEIVLASSYGYTSVYSKLNGEHLYTIKRGNENIAIEEPLIFENFIICPTIDSLLCHDKSSGRLLWNLEDSCQNCSSYLSWGSSFENAVIGSSYFLGEYPININTGKPNWQFDSDYNNIDFTGLPAFDSKENALYYTGAKYIYKIANP